MVLYEAAPPRTRWACFPCLASRRAGYVVRVESQPFAEKRVDADVAGGPPANLRVVLEVPAIKETVDVGAKTYVRQVAETATKTDTPILDVPQSVEVIPESLILDRRPASLSEALYNVSGVADGGSRRGCCDFPMIGGFDASTDVFLDGLRVERGNNNVAQEVLGLETVEVIKGPSSVSVSAKERSGGSSTKSVRGRRRLRTRPSRRPGAPTTFIKAVSTSVVRSRPLSQVGSLSSPAIKGTSSTSWARTDCMCHRL